jgi:hypothetical protein
VLVLEASPEARKMTNSTGAKGPPFQGARISSMRNPREPGGKHPINCGQAQRVCGRHLGVYGNRAQEVPEKAARMSTAATRGGDSSIGEDAQRVAPEGEDGESGTARAAVVRPSQRGMREISLRLMGMSSLRDAFRQLGNSSCNSPYSAWSCFQDSWQRHASQVAELPYRRPHVVVESLLLLVVFIADRGTPQLNPDARNHPHLRYSHSLSNPAILTYAKALVYTCPHLVCTRI